MKKICAICGELEEYHHEAEWILVPDECVCNPKEWFPRDTDIPGVCDEYIGDGVQECRRCEHDKACHQN